MMGQFPADNRSCDVVRAGEKRQQTAVTRPEVGGIRNRWRDDSPGGRGGRCAEKNRDGQI